MERAIPLQPHSRTGSRQTDGSGVARRVETLKSIREDVPSNGTDDDIFGGGSRRPTREGRLPTRESNRLPSRDGTRSTVAWPFHRHKESSVASTFGHFRQSSWHPKTFLKLGGDTSSVVSSSIIPDYVVNFIRGETPETVARRREAHKWGQKDVEITPNRNTFMSRTVEYENPFASDADMIADGPVDEQKGWKKYSFGWRGGVMFNMLLALLLLVVGIAFLIVVLLGAPGFHSEYTIYSGNCVQATNFKIGLHVVISIFTMTLLVGANYVFQVLSSPTRLEVTLAHTTARWLDIGVPSVRNFSKIVGVRPILASFVLLAAVAIQVMYNGVVFLTHNATDNFLSGTSFTTDETTETCSVQISNESLSIQAILNLVLVLVFGLILIGSDFKPLVTVGDAIASFLRHPDSTTMGACLLSKKDLRSGGYEAKYFEPRKLRWFHTPSSGCWVIAALSWLVLAVPTAIALALSMTGSSGNALANFGSTTPDNTCLLSTSVSAFQASLVAALPQLLLAILYITSNALLTTYFLSHEFSLYAMDARPLRVSADPVGSQTTSLYLTLPRPVSWVLFILFTALSFALSQALFPVLIDSTDTSPSIAALALSPLAILIFLCLLVLLLLGVIGIGFRRVPSACMGDAKGNPLALVGGSCSAVISSRCHPPLGELEPERHFVKWGVVTEAEGMDPGHCGFTSREQVGMVHEGMSYA